jgi:ADP-ribose pyrophosphatase YjhB (NUDIX family)
MNDYIKSMRKLIGHETLLTVGCGAIIVDQCGRILLQRRTDLNVWGIPGGILELGETFEETVKREVLEETNLLIKSVNLFGIYSGKKVLHSMGMETKYLVFRLYFMSKTSKEIYNLITKVGNLSFYIKMRYLIT